ncbi:MAG: uridine kinase [Firmicutes bacterium]|nr:uridine kinase [Bacillota bacterium]
MIIGIAGGSGAGKTTVARTVAERMGEENVGYLSQDWYYLDHSNMSEEEIAKENLDHPDAFDSKLLVKHLRELKEGKSIDVPIYDFNTHSRINSGMILKPKGVIVLEGILVLAIEELRSMLDFLIYVDADADIRLIRRMERDIKERSKTYDETIKRYLSSVKPMHDAFVEPSKRFADIIVPRGGDNELATDLLSDFVEHYTIHKSL